MSYIIEQKIGKHTYMYEVESYWDKTKKQPRQNRKYIGKKHPKTGKIISTNSRYTSLDYGTVYFLDKITKKIGLERLLKNIFPDIYSELLALAFFSISEKRPLYLANLWLESTYYSTKEDLSSQRISELLKNLGKDYDARLSFLKKWGKMYKNSSFIIFDITSFSSYSKKLELLEWGYNRDKEKLPQVNFGLIYGEPSSLPLFYSIYPGSISDVSTLTNMVSYLEWLELKDSLFILDKGFYSSYNLEKMEKDMHFLIPLPYSVKAAIKLIKKHSSIGSHKNAFILNGNVYYCATDKITVGEKSYHAYIYLDEKSRAEKRGVFLKKIFELEKKVSDISFKDRSKLEDYLKSSTYGWKNIFSIYKYGDKFGLKRNDERINSSLEKMGTTILISNKEIGKENALSLYRRKDGVEKFFDNMKNDIDKKRLEIGDKETFLGRLFLDFITLIVYSQISKIARQENIVKDYTIQELMYEFKKIKLIKLGEKKTIITEVSKKQRELLKKFNIDYPVKT